jgi:hypothetical protein
MAPCGGRAAAPDDPPSLAAVVAAAAQEARTLVSGVHRLERILATLPAPRDAGAIAGLQELDRLQQDLQDLAAALEAVALQTGADATFDPAPLRETVRQAVFRDRLLSRCAAASNTLSAHGDVAWL